MVVELIFTKKRNLGCFRETHGRRVNLNEKMEFRFFQAKSWSLSQFSRKKCNSGFISAKSWPPGQISRKTGNSVVFALNHGSRVKFN
jgi:hypothetical protein